MPNGKNYLAQANQSLAGNLRGKLLLVIPELDDNVSPNMTYKLMAALVNADKDFDLMVLPNANHSAEAAQNPWFVRRRWDYFVRHLLGADPPQGFSLSP
jgi:dipeptidyl aminopeptidase/acylaminoacyl peptidase